MFLLVGAGLPRDCVRPGNKKPGTRPGFFMQLTNQISATFCHTFGRKNNVSPRANPVRLS